MRTRQDRSRSLYLPILLLICLVIAVYVVKTDLDNRPSSETTEKFSKYLRSFDILESQKSMLSPDQLARHESIMNGQLLRQHIEIVLSRQHEDISWSDMYSSIRTVYDKSNSSRLHTTTLGKVIVLPDLGRESYTYLSHIVNNYDTLAAVTVFAKAAKPTHLIVGHHLSGGSLMTNSSFHDFVLSPTGHFVFTGAVWLPTLAHLMRTGYNTGAADRDKAQQRCPTPTLIEPGGSEYRFDLEYKNHLHLLKHIASRCTAEASTTCTGYSFWQKFVKLPLPKESTVFFSQGATFSVTAEQIRKRPLEDYKSLLQEVAQSADPSTGFFLEWMWYYILTSDIDPCPSGITGHEFDWGLTRLQYKVLQLPERLAYALTREVEYWRRLRGAQF